MNPDGICDSCLCKDDDILLKKYNCDYQNLQAKRDCFEYKQVWGKVNGMHKIHQNIWKLIWVYCDQTTDSGALFEVENKTTNLSPLCFVFSTKTDIDLPKQWFCSEAINKV